MCQSPTNIRIGEVPLLFWRKLLSTHISFQIATAAYGKTYLEVECILGRFNVCIYDIMPGGKRSAIEKSEKHSRIHKREQVQRFEKAVSNRTSLTLRRRASGVWRGARSGLNLAKPYHALMPAVSSASARDIPGLTSEPWESL